jgi:hypothetical protein
MLQVRAFCASVPTHAADAANKWLRDEAHGKAITTITATESVTLDTLGRRRCSYTLWIVYEESAEH